MGFRRPLLLLLVTILALTPLGSAQDADANPSPPFSVLAGSSITCSSTWPSAVVGCFWERPVLVLGALELAVGVDAEAVLGGQLDGHLAPYVVAAYYADTWSAWTEVRLPELGGIKPIGDSTWLRAGFTYRIPP